MTEQKTYLSQEKHDELQRELEHLKTARRKEVAEKLEYAKSLGDLSENAEYQQAREEQAGIEDRIRTVETILKSASIISGGGGGAVADIGSTVTVKKKDTDSPCTYEIVGSEEADMAKMKISNRSPLGEGILGKKKGDVFIVKTPKGEVEYTLIEVK